VFLENFTIYIHGSCPANEYIQVQPEHILMKFCIILVGWEGK
jgi:hypothetical protein